MISLDAERDTNIGANGMPNEKSKDSVLQLSFKVDDGDIHCFVIQLHKDTLPQCVLGLFGDNFLFVGSGASSDLKMLGKDYKCHRQAVREPWYDGAVSRRRAERLC